MTGYDQIPFEAAEFADNPEPRCPCLLLLDTSQSMQGKPIDELNRGLSDFKNELMADGLAMKRVEIGIITFGPVSIMNDFQTPDAFIPRHLETTGDTPMGAAIERGIDMIRQRKDAYRASGISYYRPWIFLITDGTPTDNYSRAAQLVKEGEGAKSFSLFAVGVENADLNTLAKISVRKPLKLQGLQFRELFAWLSSSLSGVSRSHVGQTVPLNAPTGWAEV